MKVDHTASKRDIKGFRKLCDERFAPELLDALRLLFWSDPSKVSQQTDSTEGPAPNKSIENQRYYQKVIKELRAKGKTNASQYEALQAATKMHSKIAVIPGPPGAGKTKTLRDQVIALSKIGHKVACVASSNVAVDTDAIAVWQGLTADERTTFKCLRLETNDAERAQRLAKLAYAVYTGEEGEEDKMPEYHGRAEAQDHPAIRNGLGKIVLEYASREDYAAKAMNDYDDGDQAY